MIAMYFSDRARFVCEGVTSTCATLGKIVPHDSRGYPEPHSENNDYFTAHPIFKHGEAVLTTTQTKLSLLNLHCK